MDKGLKNLLQDDSEDAILARIQEESLRYFNEVELPRRVAEQKEKEKKKGSSPKEQGDLGPQPHCSKMADCDATFTATPVTEVFYRAQGHGADGFHLDAGVTYVYPTNYPVRQYQKAIIHSALFHNTLVSLPTGLGKTFIAAVVMYNFYRWFPQGKVVFMAPTRPLVAQQIRACHDIMAVPVRDTVEMTGAMNPNDRLQHWKSKRVFFLTPQVMANDLRTGACPPASGAAFKCVVIDEAHRATKEYSYCHVIKELESAGAIFRVVALSATPGSNIKAVVEVVQNLRISTLELRGEDSPDVVPYTHAKQVEPVSLTLSRNIVDFREQYLLIFERFAKSLRDSRLITCNVQNITKFQLLKASEKLRSRPPAGTSKAKMGAMMSDFTVCMTLAHGLELLQTYGLRAFYQYFTACEDEENRKAAFTRLNGDGEFHSLMDKLAKAVSAPMDTFWSHPKHEHLVKILKDHFCQAEKQGSDTKVIIFCQYRVVVSEIYELLQSAHPLIKPVMFIGQGAGKDRSGLPQKKQIEVMKGFRQGLSNVLIATCVAEEGLDIGSVDLLVMMECQRSPVRLVQRLGRTGRHRQGRCVVLLTSGREVQKFNEAMATKKSFISMIQNSSALKSTLIRDEPQMFPPHIMPKIQLVHINVPERITPGKKKKQADIRKALLAKMNDQEEKESEESPFLDSEQLAQVENELGGTGIKFDSLSLKNTEYLFNRIGEPPMQPDELFSCGFTQQSEYNDWNRVLHQTYLVLHSSDTETLCHLLHKSEAMQLNSHPDLNSQEINLSSLLPKKKDTKKTKTKNDNLAKKKKNEKEEKLGRDIRECMAMAADKIRLTQNRVTGESNLAEAYPIKNPPEDLNKNIVEDESLQTFSDPVIVEISSTELKESNKDIKETINTELKDCRFCDQTFNYSRIFKKKSITDNLVSLNITSLKKVENLVKHLSNKSIQNINVAQIFNQNANIVSNMRSGLLRLKDKINLNVGKNINSPLISVDDIFDSESNSPLSPVLDNPIYSQRTQTKEQHRDVFNDKDQDYFNLEDLFIEDDNNICFQSLEKNTKTSTPKKETSTVIEGSKSAISTLPLTVNHGKSVGQNYSVNFKDKLLPKSSEPISPILKLDSKPVKPVFKIPQMKLDSNALSSSKSGNSVSKMTNFNISTPESPVLSRHISSNPTTNVSPILSGQVSNHDGILSPVLTGQVSTCCNNNLSPVLSGHVTSTPKLNKKVLFQDNSTLGGNNDIYELCKPLDTHAKHSETEMAEIEALNLLSASQLFDDSSEDEKKENLDQSSMYTISQMVAKVTALAEKLKVPETVDSNLSAKQSVHFENSTEVPKSVCSNVSAKQTKQSVHSEISYKVPESAESNVSIKQNKHSEINGVVPESSENNVNTKPSINFESSDEDFIFHQIDLDNFSCQKNPFATNKPPNSRHSSFKNFGSSFVSKNKSIDSLEIEKNEIEKINQLKKSYISPDLGSSNVPEKESFQRNEESFISSRWLTCMKTPLKTNKSVSFAVETKDFSGDSDSDCDVFESPLHKGKAKSITGIDKQRKKTGKPKKQGARAQFVELEADVSVTGGVACSSDEENTSGLDELEESFINDLTELPSTSAAETTVVDIHAKYLQSVRSPLKMPGYKIPALTDSILARDVFSQAVREEEDNSYENDSFCCDASQIPIEDEPSELEIAERLLKRRLRKEKGRKRKRKKSSSNEDISLDITFSDRLKKKRLLSSSSSSEDAMSAQGVNKRKHLTSSDSSPNAVHLKSKKTLKKRRRVQLLSSSGSDSDRTVL